MSVDSENDKEKNQSEEKGAPQVASGSNIARASDYELDPSVFPTFFPAQQYVADEGGIPQRVPTSRSKDQQDEPVRVPVVTVRHPGRSAIFYSVTEDEIDNYAQFNFLSSIALTLFGVSAGFLIGCVVALIQGDLSKTSIAVFWSLSVFTAVVTTLFLGASIHLYRLGSRTKETWKSSVTDS